MAHRVDHPTEDGTRKTSVYISMIGLSKEGLFLLLSRIVTRTGAHAFLRARANHQFLECKITVVRYCESDVTKGLLS